MFSFYYLLEKLEEKLEQTHYSTGQTGNLVPAEDVEEMAPPGWEGTVKAMKKHRKIKTPWALAWWMKKKGAKPHYTKKGKRKR